MNMIFDMKEFMSLEKEEKEKFLSLIENFYAERDIDDEISSLETEKQELLSKIMKNKELIDSVKVEAGSNLDAKKVEVQAELEELKNERKGYFYL